MGVGRSHDCRFRGRTETDPNSGYVWVVNGVSSVCPRFHYHPLNYYNLACADAEQGNASDARTHLQQAFDRRANIIKGESMPDPAKDDSILKLKNDKAFWTFVLALPKN
jgi:hypothetical protein